MLTYKIKIDKSFHRIYNKVILKIKEIKNGKPVIIITPQYNESGSRINAPIRYAELFGNAGGLCLVTPLVKNKNDIERLAELCDGAVFSGGDDVDPILYGEEKDPLCRLVTRDRDDFEIAFLHACMKYRKPVIGICRGIQLMNVALGGSLFQHLDGHGDGIIHDVNIKRALFSIRL